MSFDLDLTGLEIGDGLHAGSLSLPDGIELSITDRDFTIATVAAPTVAEEETSEEGEEGEEDEDGEEGAEGTDAGDDAGGTDENSDN